MQRKFSSFLISQKNKHIEHLYTNLYKSSQDSSAFSHNLLLIKGKTSTGKSLFLNILQNDFNINNNSSLISARDFSQGIKKGIVDTLLQENTIICIDDIHCLSYTLKEQEELCYLIDAILSHKKLLILSLSSDVESNFIPQLETRLLTSTLIEFPEPDIEMRLRYAQECFKKYNLNISKEYSLILARRCPHFRSILGTVINIWTFKNAKGNIPDEIELNRILISSGSSLDLTAETIITLVANYYGYTVKDLRGKKRDQVLVEARQLAMYLCRDILGHSYPNLGKIFGGKDHSSVMYAVKKIEKKIVTNKDMHIIVTKLTKLCKESLLN